MANILESKMFMCFFLNFFTVGITVLKHVSHVYPNKCHLPGLLHTTTSVLMLNIYISYNMVNQIDFPPKMTIVALCKTLTFKIIENV